MPFHNAPSPQLQAVLDAFEQNGATVTGGPDNFSTTCPSHEDTKASLSISDGEKGVLLKCHAGCDQDEVFQAAVDFTGLSKADFFYKKSGALAHGPPITVAELAAAKHIPVEVLTYFGIRDSTLGIQIPYWDVTGVPAMRIRKTLKAGDGSFWLKTGEEKTRITAYGAWMAPAYRAGGYVIMVEGETDSLTGWWYRLPVLGFPGKGTARRIIAMNPHIVEGISAVYVVEEPDDFKTRIFLNRVKRGLSDAHSNAQIFPVRLPEKDLSDLFVKRGPEGFWPALMVALESAVDAPNWPDAMPVPPSAAKVCAIIMDAGFPAAFRIRDIQRRARHMKSKEIRLALEELAAAKVVRRLPPPKSLGRPVEMYRRSPKVHS